jgi:hypothetical protein
MMENGINTLLKDDMDAEKCIPPNGNAWKWVDELPIDILKL